MIIQPYDKLTRYLVTSESGEAQYLVDLLSYWGVGQCSCPNFQIRLEPHLERRPINPNDYRCKHIVACRNLLSRQLLEAYLMVEFSKEQPVHRAFTAHQPRKLMFK